MSRLEHAKPERPRAYLIDDAGRARVHGVSQAIGTDSHHTAPVAPEWPLAPRIPSPPCRGINPEAVPSAVLVAARPRGAFIADLMQGQRQRVTPRSTNGFGGSPTPGG